MKENYQFNFLVVCSVSFLYKLIKLKIKKIKMGIQDTTRVIVQCEFEVFGHVQGFITKHIFKAFKF